MLWFIYLVHIEKRRYNKIRDFWLKGGVFNMPEIAEVETVRNTLKERILHKKIVDFKVYYKPILMDSEQDVKEALIGQEFIDIKRIGKWLLFETETHYLLSHLRMEGKYFLKKQGDPLEKHEHVEILFSDGMSMRYHDTRKFGRMKLVLKNELYEFEGIKKQGIEPISEQLTKEYLYEKIRKKSLPMKTILLDQTIISGLGNIYADEVLFEAHISPFKKGCDITLEECEKIKNSAKKIIEEAIQEGGTTIRSYTSSLGVTGRFQQYLKVHSRDGEYCLICGNPILKKFVNGRSTYYCSFCQDTKEVSLKQYYLDLLGLQEMPDFLKKYLLEPSLQRLKKVGYFCGMDYASKDIYPFLEYISRFDHSLSVALLTYRFTHDKTATIAGLFHDIATPSFSHVIDYMNEDYLHQESTEAYTEKKLLESKVLVKCLEEDDIDIADIIDFKRHTIVDNKRPKLCVDRLDGIIQSGMNWALALNESDIEEILNHLSVFTNEDSEEEIGFTSKKVARKVLKVNDKVNKLCHSKEDNYMMDLLARITKLAILKGYFSYDDLYNYDEEEVIQILKKIDDKEIRELFKQFQTITKDKIIDFSFPATKERVINPLVNGRRLNEEMSIK